MAKIDILNYLLLSELRGYEERKRIGEVEGRIIELRTGREEKHNIPHFHVRYSGNSGSYKIEDCSKFVSTLSNKDERKIKNWYDKNTDLLILAWNELYPDMPLKIKEKI